MQITISKILILRRKNTTDKVIFTTNLPEGCWPYDGNATIEMHVANGYGEKYIRQHFPGVEFRIFDCEI